MDEILVRQESPDDVRAIDVVNLSAFEGEKEARFVTALRQTDAYVAELSLVAEFDTRIVGHILLARLALRRSGQDRAALALGPMSVVPSQSHRGIGTALVRAALAKATSLGYIAVVAVGHPDYYAKFNFEPISKWGLQYPLPVIEEAVTALELIKGSLHGGGALICHPYYKQLFEAAQ